MSGDAGSPRERPKTEQVYADLRRRIRDLQLPPGSALRKDELAVEFGMSRAPINEAIARLAEEGLVEVFPQHGSFVSEIRAADLREGMFIRKALEVQAIGLAAVLEDGALLAALDANLEAQEEALKREDLTQFYILDEMLHGMIFKAVDLPRAQHILESTRAQLDRVRRLALSEAGRPRATLNEHQLIVAALKTGDADFAAQAMRLHLDAVAVAIELRLPDLTAP